MVVCSQDQDPEVILRAMRLGAREYLMISADDQQFNGSHARTSGPVPVLTISTPGSACECAVLSLAPGSWVINS